MGFPYTFYKHQIQTRKLLQSAFVKEVESIQSAESMDVSEEFSRLLDLSVELNLQVVEKGLEKSKKAINKLKIKITQLFQNVSTSTNTKLDDIIALATVSFHMGVLYSNYAEIEKLYIGEVYFMKCLELLKGKECEPKTILTTMRVFIELSLIWAKLEKPEKQYFFLHEAMMLYLKYTNEENECPDLIDATVLLGIEDEEKHPKLLLEEFYTIIMETLIELYPSMAQNMHGFVIYFHNLLEKQIADIMSRDEKSLEWANTSLALTVYFIENHRFTEARNHIAATEYILDTFSNDIQNQNNFSEELQNFYKEMRVQVANFWGRYGLRLLRVSKYKLSQDESDNTLHETDNSKSEFCTKPEKELMKFLIFADLEKDLEKKYLTNQITDKYLSNSNDAKIVFVNVLRWFNETKKYSNALGNSIQFINQTLHISYAYKYFAKYEQDKDKQINLYKLQIKNLKEALQILNTSEEKVLNPSLFASYYAQINYELSIANSFILSIKTEPLVLNIEQLRNNSIDKMPVEITELVNSNVDHLRNALEMFSIFV
ncbi:KIF-binding protein-like [Linepithema humile]|uniref:KIF-binding protein-like n=1 Tax=Linepithema humile TaxID=83485 RepID=UPI00062349A7|nr:PREDICTED: uncharacterized protein LOC105675600 isoform X1 [Linepithema humile]